MIGIIEYSLLINFLFDSSGVSPLCMHAIHVIYCIFVVVKDCFMHSK